jgi:hypothetical protein
VKDLHSLSDTEGKMTDKSLAEAAFSEMDSDNDGVVTRSVLSVAMLRIRIRRIHMFLSLPDPDPLVKGTGMDPIPDSSLFS